MGGGESLSHGGGEKDIDVVVVGAGIVGLATALAFTRERPRWRIVVLEKEDRIASHQTGRNSGVVHRGIYYSPGSLKARLCGMGARALDRFCEREGVRWGRSGKLIVATEEAERPRLEALYQRGLANLVPGLRLMGPEEAREIEPHARAVAALHSPRTAVVDFVEVAEAYARVLRERGVEIRVEAGVRAIHRRPGGLVLDTTRGEVETRHLVGCVGLHADTLASMAGLRPDVRIVPFRGEYWTVGPERAALVRGLIYPVPDPALPFLGVHLTRGIHGDVEVGPNALLALSREGRRRTDIRPGEMWDTLRYPGFWRMAWRYWRVGADEVWRSVSREALARSVRCLVPEVQAEDLVPARAGVRAQAVAADGALVDDFRIQVGDRSIHVLNAPSPAATASLAIGRYVVRMACRTFGGQPK